MNGETDEQEGGLGTATTVISLLVIAVTMVGVVLLRRARRA